jgi:trans-2,3-dihydro-3-hydroxyanthranilate isomerase
LSRHAFAWLDVFTDTPLTGNGLAVVHDADELDDAQMLGFARETKLSETSFVQSSGADGADYRNRIWMTTRELPFAGHPSLGTAVAVALQRGERDATYVQETGVGLQHCEVRRRDERRAHASMLQEPAEFGAEPDPATVFAAAGLPLEARDHELSPQIVSTGISHLIAPVHSGLATAQPNPERLQGLLNEHSAITLYLVAVAFGGERAEARGFFLGDNGAVVEDPATGSAAGPLMAYLHARTGTRGVTVSQGAAIGRASRLVCAFDDDRVRVGGDVVVLAQGTLEL